MLSQGKIADLIERQDGPGLAKLFDQLTPTQFSASARPMALTSNLTGRLTAIGLIATELARSADPPQGGALGAAVLAVARRHLDDPAHNPALIAESAAQGAYSLAQAEMHAGRFEKVLALSDEMEHAAHECNSGCLRSSEYRKIAIGSGRTSRATKQCSSRTASHPPTSRTVSSRRLGSE